MKRSRIITEPRELKETKYESVPDTVDKPTPATTSRPIEELVAATCKVISNLDVTNASGEKLGNIEDLMIDLQSGRIAYAVLSFGGFMGMRNKLFAIPWELLCLDNKWNYQDIYRQRIVFNVPKEKLEQAPGFDRDNWPREPDKNWLKDVYSYYGCAPYWESSEEANKIRPPSA